MLSNCRSGTSVIAVNESGEIVGILLGGVKTKVDYSLYFYAAVFKAGSDSLINIVKVRETAMVECFGRGVIQVSSSVCFE